MQRQSKLVLEIITVTVGVVALLGCTPSDTQLPETEAFQVFTALKRQGVPARFLYFPDENHFVTKPQNAELWWKTMHEWFVEWLD